MYIDFGKRGRINFTWKELSIVVSLFIGGVTAVVEAKSNITIAGLQRDLVEVRASLQDCKERLDRHERQTQNPMPGGPTTPKFVCGPPCEEKIAPDWTRKVR